MKRVFLILTFLLACGAVQADVILLKNGQVIEGKAIPVRDIYIRVESGNDSSYREFLIEHVARIGQSETDIASILANRDIDQSVGNKDAIQNSGYVAMDTDSDVNQTVILQEVNTVDEGIAGVTEVELLAAVSSVIENNTNASAAVIEPEVGDAEVLSAQMAPEGVQFTMERPVPKLAEPAFSGPAFIMRDRAITILLILLLTVFLWEKVRQRTNEVRLGNKAVIASSLKELEKELEEFERESLIKEKEKMRAEKRKYTRLEKSLPISLILDKVIPITAMVKNISLGGVYALCDDLRLLGLGDQCQFKLGPTFSDPRSMVYGKAEVVRIRAGHGMGLKFSGLDRSSLNYLRKCAA